MEALVNLLAQYFGIDPTVLFAAINAQQASEDNRVVNDNVALDSSDAADDESNEYVNGVYVGDNDDNDHDESNEYVNGIYVGDSDHDESSEYVNGVYVGDNDDNDHDESNGYVNGFYVGDSDHDESSEYVNGVYAGDKGDNDHDESNEYVNGVYVGDNDDNGHDDSSEYVNVVYGGSAVVRSRAGYSEISDDRNDEYRFELKGSELADGDLVDAGEQIVAKYELGRRGWEFDRLDSDESLSVQVYSNEAFIIETEYEGPGKVEFKIFSDLDGDQVWTEVVEGEVYSSSMSIDLVGLVNAGVIDPAMLLG
ncbi:hypothetical protein N9790_02775 [Gammaproteobacteria bacterium]|nr:hypothetical protein [Gammaproteobacteria bacterium]